MLSSAVVGPTLPVADLKRAEDFYTSKLGLKVIQEDSAGGALLEAGNGSRLYLYKRAPTKADHTVASFNVEDVEAEVRDLKNKGIQFEDYDIPQMGIKTVEGIATMDGMKGAWFKDTEGNILAVTQM